MKVKCANCGEEYNIEESNSGKEAPCPTCRQVFPNFNQNTNPVVNSKDNTSLKTDRKQAIEIIADILIFVILILAVVCICGMIISGIVICLPQSRGSHIALFSLEIFVAGILGFIISLYFIFVLKVLCQIERHLRRIKN